MTTINTKPSIYGLMAEFETGEDLLVAARQVRDKGFRSMEAYVPEPVEGLREALGKPKTHLARYVFCGGLTGFLFGLGLQTYAMAYSYPHNVGGRPLFSWPNFIPIIFEATILFSAFTATLGMILMNRLPTPYHAVFNVPEFERASQDRFFLCIEAIDPHFQPQGTRELLLSLGAAQVHEVPH